MSKIVHALIAKTAKEIAAEVWEVCSSNDQFHRTYPKVRPFVQRWWHEFVGHARSALVTMLKHIEGSENEPGGPRYYYTEHIRNEIFEALIIDGSHKATPQVSAAQLRANAGFEPLDDVKKSGGMVLH